MTFKKKCFIFGVFIWTISTNVFADWIYYVLPALKLCLVAKCLTNSPMPSHASFPCPVTCCERNDLIKKITPIEIIIKTLSKWTLKVNTHLQCKKIQQNYIRLEKELSKQNSSHLILHMDSSLHFDCSLLFWPKLRKLCRSNWWLIAWLGACTAGNWKNYLWFKPAISGNYHAKYDDNFWWSPKSFRKSVSIKWI